MSKRRTCWYSMLWQARVGWVGLGWAMLCNFILCFVLLKIIMCFMCFVFQWYLELWQQYCSEIVSSPCIATDRSIQDAMRHSVKCKSQKQQRSLAWSFDSWRLTGRKVTLASIGCTWILWLAHDECGVSLFLWVYVVPSTVKSLRWSTVNPIPIIRPTINLSCHPPVSTSRSVVTLVVCMSACLLLKPNLSSSNYLQLKQLDPTTCRQHCWCISLINISDFGNPGSSSASTVK